MISLNDSKGFKLFSFQLQDPKEPCISIYCYYLPELGLGNLRACCLPWKWSPFLRRPLQNQTLILCTRYNHGRHIMYRLKLISQTLERYVVDTKVIRSTQSYLESPTNSSDKRTRRFWSNKSIPILLPELSHVLAQAFPRLFHLEFMIKESYSWCNEPYAVSP